MLARIHIITLLVTLAFTPCYAKPPVRDGSSEAKAIPLKQRGEKAVEEEMAWMMKLYHYTPLHATRDIAAAGVREMRAGKLAKTVHLPQPWEHATLEHAGRWISYWMMRTPRRKRHIYFDTGISIDTPGALPQIESSRAQYMGRMVPTLKLE